MPKKYLFIDTSEFESKNFDTQSTTFQILKDHCEAQKATLLINDITTKEIYSRLSEAISKADIVLGKAQKDAKNFEKPTI